MFDAAIALTSTLPPTVWPSGARVMSLLTDATDLAIERNLKEFLPVLLVALSAASLPRIFPWLRQVPYTLLLVIVGLGLALVEVRLIDLSPGMILLIFLPPILFEAAWKMKWPDLQRELVPSSLFAIGSVPDYHPGGGLGTAPLDAGIVDHRSADRSLSGRNRFGLGAGGISRSWGWQTPDHPAGRGKSVQRRGGGGGL
jgi:hypothetical protein